MPKSEPRILVVDDQLEMARLLADDLGEQGYSVTVKQDGAEAIAALRATNFDVVVTDLRMERVDGFDVIAAAREADPNLPVIVMTAFGSIESAIEAIKKGAFHYVTKPFRLEEVRVYVARAVDERKLRSQLHSLRLLASERSTLRGMIGRGKGMQKVFDLIERVASSTVPVLIRGESGTGKELVARALHFEGARKAGAFVPVNCTAIPASLLESELFGHVKGSFTGAASARRGLFLEADGGSLFLDEIGDMAPELQAKLLRVLEDGEIRPVGADSPRRVDVRLIAATHQDLEVRVRDGAFRADLFYRLNVLPIRLPPLRERAEDLPVLLEHFLASARARNPKAVLESFSADAVRRLARFSWPGNVRELENAVERCVVLASNSVGEESLIDEALSPAVDTHPLLTAQQQLVSLRRLEEDYIQWVVQHCDGNKTRAAEILGIDVSTIHRRDKDRGRA
jgi:two-component system, NtrC family, response regulator HydG